MDLKSFNNLLERRIKLTKKVLVSKSKEYSSETDKLHNFKAAAAVDSETPEQALWGMYKKHLVSIIDMKNATSGKEFNFTEEHIDEKIGDAINYMILLEALFKERLNEDVKKALRKL